MSRINRIKKFEEFSQEAQGIFNEIAIADKNNEKFQSMYSLYVVPGGRNGGLDQNRIEIFYGNRPIGTETVDENSGIKKKLITESGATLCYQCTITGCVICTLHPARTKSFNPPEDGILIDFLSTPSKLSKRKLKRHWNYFVAYMDVTSVEDVTTYKHRLYVWYLRIFKETFINGKTRPRRIATFISSIVKYTLTVSLSGSILFAISFFDDRTDENNYRIAKSLKAINQNIAYLRREYTKSNSYLKNLQDHAGSTSLNISSINSKFNLLSPLGRVKTPTFRWQL